MPWKLSFHLKLRISRISCRLQWCKGVRRGGAQLSNGKNKNKIWGHYRVHLEHSFRIHSFSKHSDFTVKCYRQYPFHQKVAPMVQYILHLYIFNRERERGREGERERGRLTRRARPPSCLVSAALVEIFTSQSTRKFSMCNADFWECLPV